MTKTFELDRFLEDACSVGISGHVRPDGDCVGSCLGLYLYIRTWFPEIKVTVYLQEIPESFRFLTGADAICHDPAGQEAPELFFILDCSEYQRLGEFADLAGNAKRRACVDHHITGKELWDANHIRPGSSSTSELICDLMDEKRITKEMAEALYMGISHDTGMFRYTNTSPHTMRTAAMLMDKGIDFSKIAAETYYIKSYRQKQIMGRALLESIRMLDGQIIFSCVRQKDLAFYGIGTSDLDGIVSELMTTRGVHTAIFLYEVTNMEWKVSLRSSEKVDVAVIAARFGGGGHKRAAGCNMQGSVYDVVNNLAEQIEAQLGEAPDEDR